jgi:hypothetical protein
MVTPIETEVSEISASRRTVHPISDEKSVLAVRRAAG